MFFGWVFSKGFVLTKWGSVKITLLNVFVFFLIAKSQNPQHGDSFQFSLVLYKMMAEIIKIIYEPTTLYTSQNSGEKV